MNDAAVLVVEAAVALDHPAVVVGAGELHVVVDDDRLAFLSAHHGGDDVSLLILAFGIGMLWTEPADEGVVNPKEIGRRRCDLVVVMAAADIHPAQDRALRMGGK